MSSQDAESFIQGLENRSKQLNQTMTTNSTVATKPHKFDGLYSGETDPQTISEVKPSQADIIMLFAGALVALLVALFILSLLIKIKKRGTLQERLRMAKKYQQASTEGIKRATLRELASGGSESQSSSGYGGMTQGQTYKFVFFVGLFLASASRCIVLAQEAIWRVASNQEIDQIRAQTTSLIFSDLPTLFLMTSFSLFIYYIGQLTMQLEISKLGLFDEDAMNDLARRQILLQHNSADRNGGGVDGADPQFVSSISERHQKSNLLKPMFIVFNLIAYTAYMIVILSFSISKQETTPTDDQADDAETSPDGRLNPFLSNFYRVVCGINGVCFLILTVTLLNYGSRLEKIVSAVKIKDLYQQARDQNAIFHNNHALSLSHSASPTMNNNSLLQGERHLLGSPLSAGSLGNENHMQAAQNKQISSLDVRIFIVTIFLSVALLTIATTELLVAWKVIGDLTAQPEWKFLLFYLLTETLPTITISCFLNIGHTSSQFKDDAFIQQLDKGDSLLEMELVRFEKNWGALNNRSKSGKVAASGHYEAALNADGSDDDSEYGNFNPNLYAHEKQLHLLDPDMNNSSKLSSLGLRKHQTLPEMQDQTLSEHSLSLLTGLGQNKSEVIQVGEAADVEGESSDDSSDSYDDEEEGQSDGEQTLVIA